MKVGDIVRLKETNTLGCIVKDINGVFRFKSISIVACNYSDLQQVESNDIVQCDRADKLKYIKYTFDWGHVKDIIDIEDSDIQIIKALHKTDNAIRYYLYLGFRDTHVCYPSMDTALIGAIAQKYDGINTHADTFIYRMLNMDTDYDK